MNACAACQYRLKEDEPLDVRVALQADGNDSLKRVERKEDKLVQREDSGEELPPASRERIDRRVAGEDYFIAPKEVDVWDEGNWDDIKVAEWAVPKPSLEEAIASQEDAWAHGGCEDRWSNMKEKNTVKSAAKFHENGWVVLLCRHMLVLAVCDMIQSGEQ